MRDLPKNGSSYVDWKPRNSSLIQPEPPPNPCIPPEKVKEIMDKDKVWVSEPEEGFVLGRIVDITDDGVSVALIGHGEDEFSTGKVLSSSFDRLYPSEDEGSPDVEDNCGLMYLNEATLLHNVRVRYGLDKIYTYVANILIAINPYKEIKGLYSSQTVAAYRGKSLGTLPPHIFAIADKAFRDMKVLKRSQSVVVSGESGAGKTESTKYILKYLCDNFGSQGRGLEEKILNANPILEAFGNAKTTRNNNSSRFGKFIEIHFDSSCKVVGGYISHYLLERARVTSQSSQEERNYHIFYQLCAGASPELKEKLHLGTIEDFRYLRHGCRRYFGSSVPEDRATPEFKRLGPLKDPNLDDVQDFLNVDRDLKNLGMSEEDRLDVYRSIAAVLHIGNISFEDDPDDNRGGCRVTEESEGSLQITAELLKLDLDELRRALTARVMQATKGGGSYKGTVIMVPLKVHEASNARDALAKAIYSRLFDYIVRRINDSIPFEKSAYYIGVLDIAGFEYFTVNSFEQFCINYCNEKLQQFFNQRILKEEQALYEKEGLGVKKISFVDNQDCIDLIEAKGNGVLCLLDEESKLPKANHQHFTNAVHTQNTGHFRLSLPRKSKLRGHREIRDDDGFLIRHFAGAVCYTTSAFIEKNNDALHASLEALATEESQNPFIQRLFASGRKSSLSGSGRGKLTFTSVGNKFKSQLGELMEKLRSTGTNFIRCIKPNGRMVPQVFSGGSILSQLQCAGMASVLELMQQGYPSRTSFSELYKLYRSYLPPELNRLDPRHFCKVLFKALGLNEEDFKFGLTKVFFRPGKFAEFDQMLRSDPENLKELIAKVKHWLIRSHWKKVQWCTLSVIKLKNKIAYRAAALVIMQKSVRGHLARRKHVPRFKGVLRLKNLEDQIKEISRMGSKLKNYKSPNLESALGGGIAQIRSNDVISEKQIDAIYKGLVGKIHDELRIVKESLHKQKLAEEEAKRLQRLQEEMERQRVAKEAEENQLQAAQKEMKLKSDMEVRRKVEEEERIKQYEADRVEAQRLQIELDRENARLREQIEQERRDHELALRLATESNSALVEEDSTPPLLKRSTLVNRVREEMAQGKYDLSKWKYAELRDTINTSCDIELMGACREEFHRRLKVYHAWKAKNRKKNGNEDSSSPFDENMRAPKSILDEASKLGNAASSNTSPPNNSSKQRYFRIPFVRPDTGSKGWWYAHFDGDWIGRQIEIHPEKGPVLLVSGKDDMQMCELSLDETGLTRKRGAEILEQEFEKEWTRNGGAPYIRPSQRQRHQEAKATAAAR
eukprot:TRINITY_DN1165_c0_g1_i1.p1 TRINITY_DN1165_c0_g1~~TRINITY_DN1165_c0_g1_i1.p1  ORF type:complete len:1290 (+),score=487.80 TRINITY_DN1165_c0_g1_i1:159-4028(+)